MTFEKNALNCSEKDFQKLIRIVWNDIAQSDDFIKPRQIKPIGYVLGGQPGAGKSSLSAIVMANLNKNVISISGDDYRPYHPYFDVIQQLYKEDAAQYTAKFAGRMTELLIEKALNEKYNIVVEGTFRTSTVPLNTLKKMKNVGYSTGVLVQICDKKISWKSCQERYQKMLEANPLLARAVDKSHHDLVVKQLPFTIQEVYNSGISDNFEIFERYVTQKSFAIKNIFNSSKQKTLEINKIQNILEGKQSEKKLCKKSLYDDFTL